MKTSEPDKWGKILVVLSSRTIQAEDPAHSPLAQRAVEVARHTGADLEFFYLYHDRAFDWPTLVGDKKAMAMREQLVTAHATRLAEFVVSLPVEGLNVRHEVRWDRPIDEAILRKVADCRADLIMKESREHRYFVGLIDNLDWTLVRQAPVPVWFVKNEYAPIEGLVSSLGTQADGDEAFEALDDRVVAVTQALASAWQVAPKLIHTYEIPQAIPIAPHHVSSLAGTGNASALEEREELRQQILKHHEAAVQAFSERLNLPPGAIDLHEGHPGDVLPAIARRFDASLLVVGVKNRGFWERLASPVAAEPVLANTPCDVLFVRHNAENSAADKSPPGMIKGAPEFDLERAITSPADVFADPGEVLQLEAVGPALKRRILQTWRLDLHMFITDQNEGGLNSEPYLQQLEQVNHCLKQLSTSSDSPERRSSHG